MRARRGALIECDAIRPLHHFLYAYYLIVLRPAATAFRLSGLETAAASRTATTARVRARHAPRLTSHTWSLRLSLSESSRPYAAYSRPLAGAADGSMSISRELNYFFMHIRANKQGAAWPSTQAVDASRDVIRTSYTTIRHISAASRRSEPYNSAYNIWRA